MPANSPRYVVLLALLVPALLGLVSPSSNAAGMVTPSTLNRRIADPKIVESSGLAQSTRRRGVLLTHNDSGGSPSVYAVARDGTSRAVIKLAGASARDWEDITTGPRHRVWVGDVGDNNRVRETIQAYRFREPRRLASGAVTATRFELAYPDGKHDSEGIMVHPVTGRLYVVTKAPSGAGVYVAPKQLSTSSVNRLTRVAPAPASVTAASFSPNGRTFVLCNYGTAFLYRSFRDTPLQIDKPSLRQGESLDVNRGGTSLYMGSEGSRSPVYKVAIPDGY